MDSNTDVNIYEFAVQEGHEWVVPSSPADFEVFREFNGKARGPDWSPIRVRLVTQDEQGRRLLPADIPWLGKHAPVLKETASAALGAVLAPDGELLRLECEEVALLVFNVTTVIDVLDLDRSELVRFPSTGRIMKVKRHIFRPGGLKGVRAFKVPALLRGSVFVTDEVVSATASANLRGAGFRLVGEA